MEGDLEEVEDEEECAEIMVEKDKEDAAPAPGTDENKSDDRADMAAAAIVQRLVALLLAQRLRALVRTRIVQGRAPEGFRGGPGPGAFNLRMAFYAAA